MMKRAVMVLGCSVACACVHDAVRQQTPDGTGGQVAGVSQVDDQSVLDLAAVAERLQPNQHAAIGVGVYEAGLGVIRRSMATPLVSTPGVLRFIAENASERGLPIWSIEAMGQLHEEGLDRDVLTESIKQWREHPEAACAAMYIIASDATPGEIELMSQVEADAASELSSDSFSTIGFYASFSGVVSQWASALDRLSEQMRYSEVVSRASQVAQCGDGISSYLAYWDPVSRRALRELKALYAKSPTLVLDMLERAEYMPDGVAFGAVSLKIPEGHMQDVRNESMRNAAVGLLPESALVEWKARVGK